MMLDPRVNAIRPDLADQALEGQVEAERFVSGIRRRVRVPASPVKARPVPDALMETEALYGEDVLVFESLDEGWSWVQLVQDKYVGWVATDHLGPADAALTNQVAVPAALVFSAPDIKSPPLMTLPLGARICATGEARDSNATYLKLEPAGYLPEPYVKVTENSDSDWVSVASGYVGSPYLWGGKTLAGIDCSGLVQVALQACGVDCPRDTDMQEAALGRSIGSVDELSRLERGDLIFWPGHVGIMLDTNRMVHANAHHMATAIEALQETANRLESKGLSVSSIRRLSNEGLD